MALILSLIIFLAFESRGASADELHPASTIDSEKIVYLVNHGWHAGIVIQQADISLPLWPESKDLSNARFLEVGWGDKDYYQTPEPHLGIAIKAILWPTASVLHIVGFDQAVTSFFPLSEIIEVRLSNDGFERMIRFIAASHSHDQDRVSKPIAKGLYGNSQFYLSGKTYHLFNTCNAWTAEALYVAGCPIRSAFTFTVEGLTAQIRSFGTVIQKGSISNGKDVNNYSHQNKIDSTSQSKNTD